MRRAGATRGETAAVAVARLEAVAVVGAVGVWPLFKFYATEHSPSGTGARGSKAS